MPLNEPTFDSRTYREILNEAIARIPSHNPEWTNFNDSDPGITLLQLFSYMTESIIYRANLLPERNHKKFLRLLDVPMQAAQAARGIVSFSNPHGVLNTITLESSQSLYAGDVSFSTQQSLQVLPIEARLYYKSPLPAHRYAEVDSIYHALYASYDTDPSSLEYYESKTFNMPDAGSVLPLLDVGTETVDGSLWIALLARPGDSVETVRDRIAGKILNLGVMPALAQDGATLYARGSKLSASKPSLIFETPNIMAPEIAYTRLTPSSEIDLLSRPGIVELSLPEKASLNTWRNLDPLEAGTGVYPPSLEDSDENQRLITWIRMRSPQVDQSGSGSRQVHIPIAWVGLNAATVVQLARVESEQLPRGTGEPDQTAVLSNIPVITESVEIRVNGEVWQQVDELITAAAEVPPHSPRFSALESLDAETGNSTDKAYTVDRESGEVRFGDGLHGRRPPEGASIVARYEYGGGRRGTVGIGTIKKGESLPGGIQVNNPVPSWGGEDGESVEQAVKRISRQMRHRDRLVSKEDMEDIVLATPGVDLGRREVLPLLHPEQPFQESSGVVTVLVIPRNDPLQPDAPRPDSLFLQTICEYLSPRRILTTELHVRGPEYESVWLSLSIDVIPGHETGLVLDGVRNAVREFLSPLTGGFEQAGWPLNKDVETAEISATAARVSGVAKVKQVLLGDSNGEVAAMVNIEGLQLPRLMAIEVSSGTAASIAEIQGMKAPVGDVETRSTPVPVIPEQC